MRIPSTQALRSLESFARHGYGRAQKVLPGNQQFLLVLPGAMQGGIGQGY